MRSLLRRCSWLVLLLLPSASLAQTICSRTDRSGLSSVAAEVLNSIEASASSQADSSVPFPRILSTCNRLVSVPVDGPAIFQAAYNIIAVADHEVNIAFYIWEANSQGARRIGEALIAAQARRTAADPLLVRIVVDDVDNSVDPSRKINGLYDSQKNWIGMGLDPSRVRLQLATSPRPTWVSAVLHDKIILVDSRYVLVTGAQPQRNSDQATSSYTSGWHDTGYVFEGDAAQSALNAFEHTWTGDAIHWDCRPESFSYDCDKRATDFPQPVRNWQPAFGSQRPGGIPLLAVGRIKGGSFDNYTDSPQDIAWLTAMDRATSNINIESPNINDDAFQEAVKRAVARGVTVRLLTSLGFNDPTEDFPSLGGDNMEVAGRIRQAIHAATPWYEDRFQLRWYSRDGAEPITGNGIYASHTKYMTVDNRLAIIGSGNQDTPSWNISHEFNYLIDDAPTTSQLENSVFIPDWNKAAGSYLELYEGNSGTQDVVCPLFVARDKSLRFSDPWTGTDFPCNNDEARSVLLHDVAAGKVLRFYDDGGRGYQDDDWTEIRVKRPLARKYVSTFEQSFEDSDVRVIFHRDNGLDGKISSADVGTVTSGPTVDLYEGNNGSQNLVCSNRVTGPRTIVLTSDAYCNNDEARSLTLTDFPMDKVIFVYDESGGSRGDDWAVIVPKRTITQATIGSFESSFENADVRVCTFYNNGLDGKVSRVRIADRSEAIGLCGVTAATTCGEASCVPSQGMYVSHFSGPACTGTESYYLPYDGYAYNCRTWNGTGQCGTVRRTVTNRSARVNGGACQDLWPSGNTLSDFVTVYR
jgi:phosphatidylserine/phosphatidylglycerophosphate/cardiolipin synthase-like enzyme